MNLGFERSAQTSPARQLESDEMLDLMPDLARANHASANFTFTSMNASEIKMHHGRGRNTDLATKRLSNASSDFFQGDKMATEASPLPSHELLVNATMTNNSTLVKLSADHKKDGAGTAMSLRKDEMLTTIASRNNMNDTTLTHARAFEIGGSGAFQPSGHSAGQFESSMYSARDYSCLDLEFNNATVESKLLQEKLKIRESDLNLLK